MSLPRTAGRLLGASALGLAFVAACAGAAPGVGATPLQPEPLLPMPTSSAAAALPLETTENADVLAKHTDAPRDAGPPPSDAATLPRCPYGELSDPHRGFIRCLLPDERDAGWLPPPSQPPPPPPPDLTPDAAPPPPDAGKDAKASLPPLVEIGAPKFENGEVGKVEKMLNAASADIGKCVAEHGGLSGASGSLKVQFLVRSRGRAEGVEVPSAKGVSPEAASCVRLLFKNKAVGAPTADPVGVTVVITLKPAPR